MNHAERIFNPNVTTQSDSSTDEKTLSRLAALPLVDYDRQREDEAKRLGIRVTILDAEVVKRRPPPVSSTLQGQAVRFPEQTPWPDAVDGAQVLNSIAATIERYMALPPGAADVIALWIAHTYCFGKFTHTPRLNLFSPEKGCGKTTLIDVLSTMVARSLRSENLSKAVMFRMISEHKPTLLLDEVDTYLSKDDEMRGLLNAGHGREGIVYRCEGDNHDLRGFPVFAPVVLAGIGTLPGTLHDRSIVIRLVRAKPGEIPARFDSRRTSEENTLARKLARWVADNGDRLEACDPVLPDSACNRVADKWRPLFAIAQIVGGDWPARIEKAYAALTANDELSDHSRGVKLLDDIRNIFNSEKADRLESKLLVVKLADNEGGPWAEYGRSRNPISVNQLARLLKPFGIYPGTIRISGGTAKGYLKEHFREAFNRYLPESSSTDRHTVTTVEDIEDSSHSEPSQVRPVLRIDKAPFVNAGAACDGVTVPLGPLEEEEVAYV